MTTGEYVAAAVLIVLVLWGMKGIPDAEQVLAIARQHALNCDFCKKLSARPSAASMECARLQGCRAA